MSLVEGVSCVWEVRQTLVLVYVPLLYVLLGYACVHISSGSAHSSGCVVNGSSAMAASVVLTVVVTGIITRVNVGAF